MKYFWSFLFLCLCFFAHIGTRSLANPDEGRYASIGHAMVKTGDWVVPRLNGLIYFEKPPLGYWSIALGEKLFGSTLLGVRFFNALFTVLIGLSLYFFGSRFLSRATGLWAVFLYVTSLLPLGLGQMLTLDNALTFYLTATILFFASGFLVEEEKRARPLFICAYIFMALAVLTKGLIGIVLPGLVGLPWLIYTGHIKRFKRMWTWQGVLLFLAIAVPWHVLVQQKYSCFARFYFWHEHFERYLSDVHNRAKPWYFLWNSFIVGSCPWIFFLPRLGFLSFRNARGTQRQVLVFSCLWPLMILLFFSRSHSQLIPYILPAIPGLILLLAYGWTQVNPNRIRFEYLLWIVVLIGGACALPHIVAKKAFTPVPPSLLWGSQWLLWIGGGLALLFCFKSPIKTFYILCTTTFILYAITPLYLPYFQRYSTQKVCQVLNRHRDKTPASVYCYRDYYNDAPFYLNQEIGTIDCLPEEHTLGYRTEGNSNYTTLSLFRQKWAQKERCYTIVKLRDVASFEAAMRNISVYRLTQDVFFALYCNQP